MRPALHAASVLLVVAAATTQSAGRQQPAEAESPYDGRFTFVRLQWTSDLGGFRRGGFGAAWNHDHPRAEHHLALILREFTALRLRTEESLVLTPDDPELFNDVPECWEWSGEGLYPPPTRRTRQTSWGSITLSMD